MVKKKKQPFDYPKITQKHFKTTYLCPQCSSKKKFDIYYLEPSLKDFKTTSLTWCEKCNQKHLITYSIRVKRNGEPALKINKFLADDKEVKKYFKLDI